MLPADLPRRSAERVAAPRCALGESPRWARGRWWWVDAAAGTVWSAAPGFEQLRCELSSGARISLVHPARDGRMVVACGSQIAVLDPRNGAVEPWLDIELEPGWLLNDGTADAAGDIWIGSVHPERAAGSGRLHRVSADGTAAAMTSGTQLSNGMVWTPDGALLHVDSLARTVTKRRRAGPDALQGGEPWVLPECGGLALPDGMALDVDGGIWLALYGAGTAVRVLDGAIVDSVRVPTAQVTSIALGGADGRDLLLTTAQEGLDAAALAADPNAGALFAARAAVPGLPQLEARTP